VIKQQYEETDATRHIAEFQETRPYIERMNEIRKELQETHKEGINERLEKGELRPRISTIRPEGLESYEDDNPGATGSGEPMASIKAFKMIKVELEEDKPEEGTKIREGTVQKRQLELKLKKSQKSNQKMNLKSFQTTKKIKK
jgi:hypothetical protein